VRSRAFERAIDLGARRHGRDSMRSIRFRQLVMVPLLLVALAIPRARAGGFGGIQFDTFSFDLQSPEQFPLGPYSAADVHLGGILPVFPPDPAWRPFGAFGLLVGDEVDGITFGGAGRVFCPPGDGFLQAVYFSVGMGALGDPANGDAIIFENAVDEAEGDIFVQQNNGALKGIVLLHANAGPRFGVGRVLGLTDGPVMPFSNTDAWSGGGPAGNIALMPMLISVGPATAARLGITGADILLHDPLVVPPGIAMAIPGAALGLGAGDDIDALDASTVNVRAPAVGDWIYFSLRAGSPALGMIGAGPGDILYNVIGGGGPPQIWSPAAAHGLLPGDELDALDIWDPGFPTLIEDGGFLESHAGHRCSWPVPLDLAPHDAGGEPVVEASASIPSPANCTVDACLRACPGGDVLFNVIVRDIANNRLAGARVELNFTGCPEFVPCEAGDPYTVDWEHRSIRMTTDLIGVASFPLRGGGTCGTGTVEVRVDGVFLATRALASPDQDANLMVDGVDRLLLSTLEDTAAPAGDFDCSGLVNGAFDPQDPPPPPPLLDAPAASPAGRGLTVRLTSHPLRAGSMATLVIGTRLAGTVVAELHDLSGRRIERFAFESAAHGPMPHSWRVPSHLPAGVYSLRLRRGADETSIRVIVLDR